MITTKGLRDWLAPMIPAVFVGIGPEMPDKPDRAAIVTRGPGGRIEMEGVQARSTFTVRMRGPIRDSETPELDLEDLRLAIEGARFPLEIGGHAILSVWPSGLPYPLPGPDSGRRYEFVQVFNLQTSTDI